LGLVIGVESVGDSSDGGFCGTSIDLSDGLLPELLNTQRASPLSSACLRLAWLRLRFAEGVPYSPADGESAQHCLQPRILFFN